jgi:hypothetical protein
MTEDFYEDFVNDSSPKIRPLPRRRFGVPVPQVPEAYKNTVCPFVPHKYPPIINIEGYIRDANMSEEKEREYRALYTPSPQEEVEKEKTPPNVPRDPLTVFTKIKVLKNEKVRVEITVPMEQVHEYEKRGKVAPLSVRVRAAKAFGYDEDILTKMIQVNDTKKIKIEKLDSFINGIFGSCLSAKTNKPKKKTVQESLNSKFKKKPAKKYS